MIGAPVTQVETDPVVEVEGAHDCWVSVTKLESVVTYDTVETTNDVTTVIDVVGVAHETIPMGCVVTVLMVVRPPSTFDVADGDAKEELTEERLEDMGGVGRPYVGAP